MSAAAALDQWKHRGWEITADHGHPQAAYVWTATGPNFDCDLVDGQFVVTGGCVHAATYEELLEEIENYIAGEDA